VSVNGEESIGVIESSEQTIIDQLVERLTQKYPAMPSEKVTDRRAHLLHAVRPPDSGLRAVVRRVPCPPTAEHARLERLIRVGGKSAIQSIDDSVQIAQFGFETADLGAYAPKPARATPYFVGAGRRSATLLSTRFTERTHGWNGRNGLHANAFQTLLVNPRRSNALGIKPTK
jgi:hypothetical protein